MLTDRSLALDLSGVDAPQVDLVLDRCVAHTRGGDALRTFNRVFPSTIVNSSIVPLTPPNKKGRRNADPNRSS